MEYLNVDNGSLPAEMEATRMLIGSLIEQNPQTEEMSDSSLMFRDKENMIKHGILYTRLLGVYVSNAKNTLPKKLKLKEDFYHLCVFILSFTCAMFFIVIFLMLTGVVPADNIAVIIGTFVSFLTVFIVIPHTIASYLFNSEEEKYMTDIIKSMQEHDVEIRKGIQ